MATPQSSIFKKKQTYIIAAIVLFLIAIATFFFYRKIKPADYSQQYVKYIESYTSGTISKKSTIIVHLAAQVTTMNDVGKPDDRDLFDFSPSIKGKTYWLDAQTVEFRPDEPLESGESYKASFALNKITETEKDLTEFEFEFRVISSVASVIQNGLVSQNNTSLDFMKLTGVVTTSDQEDPKEIEKILSLDYGQKLKIKWQHDIEKNTYSFYIDSIKKFKEAAVLKLNWSGKVINADDKGSFDIEVPALGSYRILAIKAVQDQEDYALIQLSEPINVSQDLTGLITLNSLSDLRFTIDRSQIKVYSTQNLEGNYTVNVDAGIENIQG
ncbi:MAG: hypothetical protein EOP48_05135, partial [Sphingobacteriales bacterium]